MEILRFAHHFFHFNHSTWEKLTERHELTWRFARTLFSTNLLPRRALRDGDLIKFEEAQALHSRQLEEEEKMGIRAVCPACGEYPEVFEQFLSPERRPALLYIRGAQIPVESKLIAVVGTRAPSEAGQENARSFSAYFTTLGLSVVSGLARGIDTLAHEENISLGTVAVLGGGVGSVYPSQNQMLAEKIIANGGTLVSPFPLAQVPLPQNFPERNELIAAISAGTIVIEGAEKSGASITGRLCLSMGKTAVVLSQDFRSEFGRGAIRLHEAGAEFVTKEEEALQSIFRRFGGYQGTQEARALFSSLKRQTFSIREFLDATQKPLPETLALLEEGILHGRIERIGSRFRLK